ncbi:hypothetical protein TL16_g10580 [Triparma laevis f. inornata]|uniref:Uncharacterized protein n=1 Tax=Triparma laevis f. inornata TaxID=1714386 RepID=A0A9W7BHZ9_9STRA|nr:hypothetical protein TL16_g10580 [Triparma laevis f. inornata]
MDIANDIDDDDNLFRFIEGDDKVEDLSMLKVVWEGESKNSEAYAPSHLIQKGRVSKAKKDQKILRLAKARIWSEKVRAKNARARAKCEVESVRILNERLRGVGGRNAPILAILEKEATRLQTFLVEKARLSRKADRTFVKRMIEKHEEFGVELKLRKRKGKGRRKKEENLEEDGPSSELSSISISKPLKQEDEELPLPPSLDRSVDAGLGVVAWEDPNPNSPSTTTSGASAFAKDSDSDDLNVIDEPSQVNPTNSTNKEDINEQQLNITTCGFFKPTKSSLSPRTSSAPTSSSKSSHSPFKTLTRTKSGQKRLKTAKEVLGPPNFSPSRCKQSVSDLESQLNAEIESKKAARAARGKLAMMEQDAKRRKRRMKEEKERRGGRRGRGRV